MIEKHIVLDDVDLVAFYGVRNIHLQMLKALYPKLRVAARGNVVKVMGDEEAIRGFEETVERMRLHCVRYNSLSEQAILSIVKGEQAHDDHDSSAICYTVTGKPVVARSENQRRLVAAYEANDMLFAVGPAGSGKTYVSIALAVRALKNKEIRRLILSRPAVEAGEKLGFLPGDMKEKIDPYLQPLYDALGDMLPSAKLNEMMEDGTIEIAPLAFMRGRTLSNAFVILDEAQNATMPQIKMFLTRMGVNAKFIITGDPSQVDLPDGSRNGLMRTCEILDGLDGIRIIRFGQEDIVRHQLVQRIVKAFDKADKGNRHAIEEKEQTQNKKQ